MAREMAETVLPRYKVDAERRSGAGRSRRGRHHLQPGNESGALGRELAEPAVDRQHHQGDDGDGLPREQSRSHAAGDDRAQRRLSGVDDASARERSRDGRRPAAPAADRVRQRRRSRARAHLAVRLGRLHPAHEREGRRARAREHALRRSVGPAVGERLVRVRHGAPHHARVERRAHRVDHADARVHRVTPRTSRRSRSTAPTICSAAPTSTCAPARPASSRRRATAWRRCCGCRRAARKVAVVVLGARSNAGRFMETQNLFSWLSTKATTLFAAAAARTPPSHTAQKKPELLTTCLLQPSRPFLGSSRRSRAASRPRRAAAWRSNPPPP